MKRAVFISHLILFICFSSSAQELKPRRDTLRTYIHFRQGYSQVDTAFADNKADLQRLVSLLDSVASDSLLTVRSVTIEGGSSPEGDTRLNRSLSERRALNTRAYITTHTTLQDTLVRVLPSDVDWELLGELVAATAQPWRDEALDIIANTPVWIFKDKKIVDGRKQQLCRLHGGRAWAYMSKNFFPALRNACCRITCEWETVPPAATAAVATAGSLTANSLIFTPPHTHIL